MALTKITKSMMADESIDSNSYVDASIDAEHLSVGKDGALSLDATPDTDHTANGPQTSTLNAGYSYDADKDKFIMPKPYPSWALDENDDWQAPVACPEGKNCRWDEDTTSWKEIL